MTLTIQDLGALGEFLGSIAVLVTLGYLAFQTRQNTMAIGAQLDGARINALLSINLAMATSSELQEAIEEGRPNPRPPHQVRIEALWMAQLNVNQWQLFQARRGLLPTVNLGGMERAIQHQFRFDERYGVWWERNKGIVLPEFVAWVEEQRAKAA